MTKMYLAQTSAGDFIKVFTASGKFTLTSKWAEAKFYTEEQLQDLEYLKRKGVIASILMVEVSDPKPATHTKDALVMTKRNQTGETTADRIQASYALLDHAQAMNVVRDARYICRVGALLCDCVEIAGSAVYTSYARSNVNNIKKLTFSEFMYRLNISGLNMFIDGRAIEGLYKCSKWLEQLRNHKLQTKTADSALSGYKTELKELSTAFDYVNLFLTSVFKHLKVNTFIPKQNCILDTYVSCDNAVEECACTGTLHSSDFYLLFDCPNAATAFSFYTQFVNEMTTAWYTVACVDAIYAVEKMGHILKLAVTGSSLDLYDGGMRFAEDHHGEIAFIGVTSITPNLSEPDEVIVLSKSHRFTTCRENELRRVIRLVLERSNIHVYSNAELASVISTCDLSNCSADYTELCSKAYAIRDWVHLYRDGSKGCGDKILEWACEDIENEQSYFNVVRLLYHFSLIDSVSDSRFGSAASKMFNGLRKMVLGD